MTADAEEEQWMNRTGWFGSLINAQIYSNEVVMGANKERIPMILEYMTHEVDETHWNQEGWRKANNRKTITMYINPSRMQFSNQKLTSESVTRGGIFYHHWGDKNMVISLSGDLGLSSMSGVKKLDEVYRMSGVLLRYGLNSQGPVYWDADTELMNKIASGDWAGAINMVIQGKYSLSDLTQAAQRHTIGAAQDAITGHTNNGLDSSLAAGEISSQVGGALQKVTDSDKGILTTDSPIGSVADTVLQSAITGLGEKIGDKLYKRKNHALDYLDENVVKFSQAFGGFSDVIDELEDPWRPRLIWI